jgi:hypothetical protein
MERLVVDKSIVRQESSVPVQSRVSIVTLAEMVKYWESAGVMIETMSQLVSWSVDLAREILVANEKIEEVNSVEEAHRELEERRLYQRGMKGRSVRKIANAMTLGSLRMEGVDPESYASRQYNMVHKVGSVRVFKGKVVSDKVAHALETYEKLYGSVEGETEEERENRMKTVNEVLEQNKSKDEKYEEIRDERLRIQRAEFEKRQAEKLNIVSVKEGMSEEEFMKQRKERDEDIIARENAPFDPSEVKTIKNE